MELQAAVNEAKRTITDAVAGLALQLDSSLQAAAEALEAKRKLDGELEAKRKELAKLEVSVPALRLEHEKLTKVISSLKATLSSVKL